MHQALRVLTSGSSSCTDGHAFVNSTQRPEWTRSSGGSDGRPTDSAGWDIYLPAADDTRHRRDQAARWLRVWRRPLVSTADSQRSCPERSEPITASGTPAKQRPEVTPGCCSTPSAHGRLRWHGSLGVATLDAAQPSPCSSSAAAGPLPAGSPLPPHEHAAEPGLL